MKTLLSILLFIIWTGETKVLATNQATIQDSLILKLEQNLPTQERVQVLLELAEFYQYDNPSLSLQYALQSDSLSVHTNLLKDRLSALILIGIANRELGELKEAISKVKDGLALVETPARIDTAIIFRTALLKSTLGTIYRRIANNEEALTLYQEALQMLDSLEVMQEKPNAFRYRKAKILTNIGVVHSSIGQYEYASDNFKQALSIQNERSEEISFTYFNAGSNFLSQKNYDSARLYFQQSIAKATPLKQFHVIRACYHNLGILFKDNDQFDSAEYYLYKSIDEAERLGQKMSMAHSYGVLTDLYIKLNQLDKAEMQAIKGLKISEDGAINVQLSLSQYLAEVYEKLNQPKNALFYLKKSIALNDSLYSLEQARNISEMEARFESEQKDKELAIQKQEIELLNKDNNIKILWRNLFGLGFILVFITAFFVIRNKNLRMKRKQEKMKANEALTIAKLENAKLKSIELEKELDHSNQQLASYTLNFIQKNELLNDLKDNVTTLQKGNTNNPRELQRLKNIIQQHSSIDQDWNNFKLYFEKVHKDFFQLIKQNHPDLTGNDFKLCALIRLNLNIKEAAIILGISPESVKTARYRLRKKLNLDQNETILDYLLSLEKNKSMVMPDFIQTENY